MINLLVVINVGRAKRKRKAKQKAKRLLKIKSGKRVRFVLANSPQKYQGWSNKYNYQSNIHNLIYKDASFTNDKFHNCTITKCNFKNTKLSGIDFAHCNLKETSFKGATLNDVTFFNCNMKSVDFENAVFNNVVFISMNTEKIKSLPLDGYTVINKYPKIDDLQLIQNALTLSSYKKIYKYHVLHVEKNKLNNWYLYLILRFYVSTL